MNKINIVLDLDSTSWDTIQVACDWYTEKYFKHPEFVQPIPENVFKWNFEDEMPLMTKNDVNEMFQSQFFFDNVKWFDNAVDIINKLHEDERFNVSFCSIGSFKNVSKKTKHVGKTFPTINQTMLVKQDLNNMCKKIVNMNYDNIPTIFVDDSKSNLDGSNAKYKILYTQFGDNKREWNLGWDSMFTTNWNDLYELVNSIYNYEFRIYFEI